MNPRRASMTAKFLKESNVHLAMFGVRTGINTMSTQSYRTTDKENPIM